MLSTKEKILEWLEYYSNKSRSTSNLSRSRREHYEGVVAGMEILIGLVEDDTVSFNKMLEKAFWEAFCAAWRK